MTLSDYFSLGALIFLSRAMIPTQALFFGWVCLAGQLISFFFGFTS